jgi:excisionase family DNA binding protein
MNERLLYRVSDVAACLSLSRTKVYELVRSRTLPSVRIGGARRVRGVDLAAYVDSLARVASLDPLAETVGAR